MKQAATTFLATLIVLLSTSICHSHIVINEIMYRPLSMNSDDEYIEIFNSGSTAVDLSGWSFNQGIEYRFPAGVTLEPGGYLVLSPNPDQFEQTYGTPNILGAFDGKLNNNGEAVALIDQTGLLVDRVEYSSELGWPVEADGYGPSLERLHADMPSSAYQSWSAGPPGGTPGQANQSALALPKPVVLNVEQSLASPHSDQSVPITCQIVSHNALSETQLYYKAETEPSFQSVPLLDDGAHQDGSAADDVYGAAIPPYPHETIVEFYISAVDTENQFGSFPVEGSDRAAIYMVNDEEYPTDLPLYRIVMRARDERILRSRDPRSNDELPGSFVYDNHIYHDVLIRFRGKGSRNHEPKNYRVNFSGSEYFGEIRKLNVNIVETDRQFIGLETFKRLGLPAPEKKPVSVLFNQTFIPNYLMVERTDREMMKRVFGDGGGNLYRGIEQANFDYRGESPDRYRQNYAKETNEREDDYTDIIRLCDAFSLSSDEEFAQRIAAHINVQQWVRWFALKQILNDLEGGLSKERGDDYYIYNNPQDNLFYLLPWDFDSVMADPISEIHHHGTPAVQRLLRHPDIARFYYKDILQILDNELTTEVMNDIIDQAAPISTPDRMAYFRDFFQRVRQFHYDRIPRSLTVEISNESQGPSIPIIEEGEEWRFFRGRTEPGDEPLAWTAPAFDDSAWETGASGFGYGDGDDRTVLDDMRYNYTTVFTRNTFQIDDPSQFSLLTLSVIVDDGFVAYLNGTEIARHNVDGTPTYRSTTPTAFEANRLLTYFIPITADLIFPGSNTLAVIGMNTNLTSSDLTLRVALDGTLRGDEIVQLHGMADAANTRWVRVNGELADFVPWQATWTAILPNQPGRHCVLVEALDAFGQTIESKQLPVYIGMEPPDDGVELCGDTVWDAVDAPMQVETNIIVPEGESLTIAPGSVIQMAKGTSIVVYGTFHVNGTSEQPVRLESLSPGSTWGTIAVDGTGSEATISYAELTGNIGATFRDTHYPGAITVRSSTVTVANCTIHGTTEIGGLYGAIDADRSVMAVRGNHFHTTGEAVHCNNSFSTVEDNLFEYVYGPNDGIDFDGQMGGPSIVRGNTFLHMDNDAIDTGYTSAIIERNWIVDCGDKGISLEGTSEITANNNVILDTLIGIAVKDQCMASLAHNTIVHSVSGIWLYEKNAGRGGGVADVVNTIVWDTETSIAADDKSTLFVQSSDFNRLPPSLQSNNFSNDPHFIDPANLNFHLQPGSPLIDAGIETDVAVDFDGKTRPQGRAPDLGAFEANMETAQRDWMLHIH